MSIDFKTAPTGATHYNFDRENGVMWFKLYRDTAKVWRDGRWVWHPFEGVGGYVSQILGAH